MGSNSTASNHRSRSKIINEAQFKRSSCDISSLLAGLGSLSGETISLFQLPDNLRKQFDDEAETEMKDILGKAELENILIETTYSTSNSTTCSPLK